MKPIGTMILLSLLFFLMGCGDNVDANGFIVDEDYELIPLTMVAHPAPESEQDDDVAGIQTKQTDITELDWTVIYDNDIYAILQRDVPDDMIFIMIGYPIEDGACRIGAKTRYQYVISYHDAYYDIWEFHQKYHNLSCSLLTDLGIS